MVGLPTSIAEPDIWSVTPVVTYDRRGDYIQDERLHKIPVNKTSGGGTAIKRGYVLSKSNLVTPNTFGVAGAGAAKPLVVSGLPFGKDPAVTSGTQAGGEDLSATDNDKVVEGIIEGYVVLKMGSDFQPMDRIMTDTSGDVQVYDGSGEQKVCGYVFGKAGTFGYNQVRQGGSTGDLAMCYFNGGV